MSKRPESRTGVTREGDVIALGNFGMLDNLLVAEYMETGVHLAEDDADGVRQIEQRQRDERGEHIKSEKYLIFCGTPAGSKFLRMVRDRDSLLQLYPDEKSRPSKYARDIHNLEKSMRSVIQKQQVPRYIANNLLHHERPHR